MVGVVWIKISARMALEPASTNKTAAFSYLDIIFYYVNTMCPLSTYPKAQYLRLKVVCPVQVQATQTFQSAMNIQTLMMFLNQVADSSREAGYKSLSELLPN